MPDRHTMDFFGHQDMARRNTKRLVILFAIAVGGIVTALYILSQVVIFFGHCRGNPKCVMEWWDPVAFIVIAFCVILFIAIISGIKILILRRGGAAVATMLGGRPVDRMTDDPGEKRFLNVVDEMAIASGVTVPQVFILDKELGINAFAAGIGQDDATITVTKGTLDHLSRDELQGVVAHEFSHVLNGDMRLNIYIMGLIYGILAISIVGRTILRGMSRSRGKKGGAIVLAAVGLLIIGYIGVFVGRLIQSAVCRQREFLADASAVQFTRNPAGIAGALQKIGGLGIGSIIKAPKAEQASHLFFGNGVKLVIFSNLLSSHPPLAERIRRIDPTFAGTFATASPMMTEEKVKAMAADLISRFAPESSMPVDAKAVVGAVGRPTHKSLQISAALIAALPDRLRSATSERNEAQLLVYAMLLDRDDAERAKQLERLGRLLRPSELETTKGLFDALTQMDDRLRFTLFELAIPSLATLVSDMRDRFAGRVNMLVSSDSRVTLFEFAIQYFIEKHLLTAPRASQTVYRSARPVAGDINTLISALAREGNRDDGEAALRAYRSGTARIDAIAKKKLTYVGGSEIGYGEIRRVLNRLRLASFDVKRSVVDACAHCAIVDNRVTVREWELLRVTCLALDCPIPPVIATHA